MLYLTPQQQESFKQNSFFDVDVKGGGRIRLKPTRAYNAELLESNAWGKRGTRFCAVPSNNHELPICDQLLIQKLWLETDPQKYFAVANRDSMHATTRYPLEQQVNAARHAFDNFAQELSNQIDRHIMQTLFRGL